MANTLFGLLAEYEHPAALLRAAEKVRDAGYQKFDTYSPFPVHGMDDAMGLKPSKLGWIVFIHGLLGLTGALAMITFMAYFDYQVNISGKPYLNWPAFVPVTFELTVLLSAFGAVFGMFFLNGLPRHNHPLFNSEKFLRATDDKFFLCIESEDTLFAEEKAQKILTECGAIHIEKIYDND